MQSVYLGLVGHQRREEEREPDRLRAQFATHWRPVARVEDEVDGGEDGAQPLGQQVLRRDAEWNAGVADLALRANEPLRERRFGDDEGPRDLRRRQPADEAERQGHLRVGGQRGVAAGEDQLEPLVGDHGFLVVGYLFGAGEQLRLPRERLLAADPVDRAVARRRDDPRAGVRRCPVPRPAFGRDDERILNRVLGEVEVAEDTAENRDAACTLIPIRTSELVYAPFPEWSTMGRTSIVP